MPDSADMVMIPSKFWKTHDGCHKLLVQYVKTENLYTITKYTMCQQQNIVCMCVVLFILI